MTDSRPVRLHIDTLAMLALHAEPFESPDTTLHRVLDEYQSMCKQLLSRMAAD